MYMISILSPHCLYCTLRMRFKYELSRGILETSTRESLRYMMYSIRLTRLASSKISCNIYAKASPINKSRLLVPFSALC